MATVDSPGQNYELTFTMELASDWTITGEWQSVLHIGDSARCRLVASRAGSMVCTSRPWDSRASEFAGGGGGPRLPSFCAARGDVIHCCRRMASD